MTRRTIVGVDLGFGDAGKGSITDFLVRETDAHTVVRYNGGAQAAHRVVTSDGRDHVFSQFGSGMFIEGVRTFLSQYMMIDPTGMLNEGNHLKSLGVKDVFSRTSVDERALVISPFQRATNRLREMARGNARHGSCGLGIGETKNDFIRFGGDRILLAKDLHSKDRARGKLLFLKEEKEREVRKFLSDLPECETARIELSVFSRPDIIEMYLEHYVNLAHEISVVTPEYWRGLMSLPGNMVFEGSQGVLLDESFGFHPHTTWSSTTLANAMEMLSGYGGEVLKLGITRAYSTRHGPGPFPTYDEALSEALPDSHNYMNPWQREFRVGWLDLAMLQYACEVVGGVDMLAVTCLDRLNSYEDVQCASKYEKEDGSKFILESGDLVHQEALGKALLTAKPVFKSFGSVTDLLKFVEKRLSVPVGITSAGPAAEDKIVLSDYFNKAKRKCA